MPVSADPTLVERCVRIDVYYEPPWAPESGKWYAICRDAAARPLGEDYGETPEQAVSNALDAVTGTETQA